ncbi:unnamed protein product [Polarella glacialis]|uniref:Uncharacterized protein n=1 Tax=Polarella glacialis TaxID=89957 RepID=A0A813F9N7_POLGL|nr:unnamed protein product [Polarella glacialis]
MPIRLEIMKDWHRKTLGPCSEVYPDEMPATHWLAKGSLGRPNGKFPGWDRWPKEEDRKADALKKDTKATKDARDTKDTTKKGGKDKGLRRGSTKAVETKSEDQPGGRALPTKAELEAAAIKIQSAQRCRVARGIFADRKLALLFATNKGTEAWPLIAVITAFKDSLSFSIFPPSLYLSLFFSLSLFLSFSLSLSLSLFPSLSFCLCLSPSLPLSLSLFLSSSLQSSTAPDKLVSM